MFAKFTKLGSVPKVNAYCTATGLQFSVRVNKGSDKGRLLWWPATRHALYEVLRHPFYAGGYGYGRCPVDSVARSRTRCRCLHLVGALRTKQKQATIAKNDRGRGASRSPSGWAETLLNGRLRCGRCGLPMGARNARPGVIPRYDCDYLRLEGGPDMPKRSASAVDRLIEELVFGRFSRPLWN